jgi:hypothetical protein
MQKSRSQRLKDFVVVVAVNFFFSVAVFAQGTKLSVWSLGSESVSMVIYKAPVLCKRNLAVEITFPNGLHNSTEWLVWTVNYKDCNQNIRYIELATPIGERCSRSNEFLSIIQSGASSKLEGEHTTIFPNSELNNMDVIIDITNPHIVSSYSVPKLSEGSACTAPTSVSSRIENMNEAVITWQRGSANSKYRVLYRKVGTIAWIISQPLSNNTYRIPSLDYRTDYEYKVAFLCPSGDEESDIEEFTTLRPACKVPLITIQRANLDTLQLSWTDTKSKQYILQQRTAGGSWSDTKHVVNNTQLTNLKFGTNYEYRVAASDSYGICDYSPIVTHRTISNPCGNPTNLVSGEITSNSVELTWSSSTKPSDYWVEYAFDGQTKNQSIKDARLVLSGLPYNSPIKVLVYNRCLNDQLSDSPSQIQVYTRPERATINLCTNFQFIDSLRIFINSIPVGFSNAVKNSNGRCAEKSIDLFEKNNFISIEYGHKRFLGNSVVILPGMNEPMNLEIPDEIVRMFEYRRREVTGNYGPFIPLSISIGGSIFISSDEIDNFQSSVSISAQRERFCADVFMIGLENVPTGSRERFKETFQPNYLLDGSIGYHFSKFSFETLRKTDKPGVYINPEGTAVAGLHIGTMNWYNTEVYQAKVIDTEFGSSLNVHGKSQLNGYAGIHFKSVSYYSMIYRMKRNHTGNLIGSEQVVWKEWNIAFDYLHSFAHVFAYYDTQTSTFSSSKIGSDQVSAGYRCSAKWSSNLFGSRMILSVQGSFINLPSMYSLRELSGFKNNNLFYNLTFGFGWACLKR